MYLSYVEHVKASTEMGVQMVKKPILMFCVFLTFVIFFMSTVLNESVFRCQSVLFNYHHQHFNCSEFTSPQHPPLYSSLFRLQVVSEAFIIANEL